MSLVLSCPNLITDPRLYKATWKPFPAVPEEVLAQMWEHARKEAPYECCGAIVGDGNGKILYLPKQNIHPKQEDAWKMSKEDQADILSYPRVIALVHSHPDGPAHPSELDMKRQAEWDIPWVIMSFGKGLPDEAIWLGCGNRPLLNRTFRHGITDCFEFGRDYYLYHLALRMRPRPREWRWWKHFKNNTTELKSMYLENYLEEGFVDVHKNARPQIHDAFLLNLRSKVPNHLAIYVGNGLIAHHPASFDSVDNTKLSIVEPYERWAAYHTHTLRYGELDNG